MNGYLKTRTMSCQCLIRGVIYGERFRMCSAEDGGTNSDDEV